MMSIEQAAMHERHQRHEQLKTQQAMLAELKEVKLLLLEIGKSLIDIQALVHPAALLNTLANIKDRAAAEESRAKPQPKNGAAQKRAARKRRGD